ncbi:MAG: hypothetical protein JW925_10885 [Syntrophaceae bacterium]|nr:hypothetical protein [Syntrophaceae bacterium]
MKKTLLLGLAAISALICAELIIAKIIGYPTYGVEMKMMGIRGLDRPVNIFKPYSKYWTVEGGNKVYRRNNIGLPGMDIKISNKARYIYVLGSSFVEAYQLPPTKIATSIFQTKIQIENSYYEVLNLGISGHDPYDLYWRAIYFEKKYPPARVFLVIDSTIINWFQRQRHPLNFDQKLKAPTRFNSLKMKYLGFYVNNSSLLNLLSKLRIKRGRGDNEVKESGLYEMKSNGEFDSDLIACISNYKKHFADRFSLISIINDNKLNSQISDFCNFNNISFISRIILLPKYRLNGKGHLNIEGNKLLGEMLHESFIRFDKK